MPTSSRYVGSALISIAPHIYLLYLLFTILLQKVNVLSDDQWPSVLAEYIRHNDEAMLKASERVLATYRDELLPSTSFEEFCDVAGNSFLPASHSLPL